MRILHITGSFTQLGFGIKRQLLAEQSSQDEFARRTDSQWHTELIVVDTQSLDELSFSVVPRKFRRFQFAKLYVWWRTFVLAKQYDVVLLRAMAADPFCVFIAPFIRNLYTVHHTKEIEELDLLMTGKRRLAAVFLEKNIKPLAMRRLRGVVGVTAEIADYEMLRFPRVKKSFVFPNGIEMGEMSPVSDQRIKNEINLLFVSSVFYPWQGLDLLLAELSRHGESDPKNPQVKLHLVGKINNEDQIVISRLKTSVQVVQHGTLAGSELDRLFEIADVGLSSFALGRQGLGEACSLKVREYLNAGIPVFAGHRDSALPDDFPYYEYEVGELSFDRILRFAEEAKGVSREAVRREARPYINKQDIMIGLTDAILGKN